MWNDVNTELPLRCHVVKVRLRDGTEEFGMLNMMNQWIKAEAFYNPLDVAAWQEINEEELH